MSTVDLNWFTVITRLDVPHARPRKTKQLVYGIHQRHPARFTPYDTVVVYNLPPGDKYTNIKKLSEHLQHVPSIGSFWYPELRLDESKCSEDTLFIGLVGREAGAGTEVEDDILNVLNYLPRIHDFGNTLIGERFFQQQLPDVFKKLKVLSHVYMQIGLFDEEVVFRVGSRVSNTQYQEYRWLLDKEIYYEPLDPNTGNPRIFTLKLNPACGCIEPEKHGDMTSPEGQTIDSITNMITSVIRDTLSQKNGKVKFEFVLQYKKYDQSFREMFDPEGRPPTEYWSDEDYPTIVGGSGPQVGSQSDDGPHYYRTNINTNQDPSRSRERHRSGGLSGGQGSEPAPTPSGGPGRHPGRSINDTRTSREQSQYRDESKERSQDPSSGRGRPRNWEWYQPPGYYRPKASTEQSQSFIPGREQPQNRNRSVEPGRNPRSSESQRQSYNEEELRSLGNSEHYRPTAGKLRSQSLNTNSYHQSDRSGSTKRDRSSSESNESFSTTTVVDDTDQMVPEE